jgi:hypothetical protein
VRGKITGARALIVCLMAAALAVFGSGASALADTVRDFQDNTVDVVDEVMTLFPNSPAIGISYAVIPQNGDGKNGCNFSAGRTMTAAVTSSDPTVVTTDVASIVMSSCSAIYTINVQSHSAVGSARITLSQTANTTGGTFDFAPASVTVNVVAPPNSPPSVKIAGVTEGGTYQLGSVPAATCTATDAEDGTKSVTPTVSAVTGPGASYGVGQQSVSCTYKDAGGLIATDSVTYLIMDTTAPVVTVSPTRARDGGTALHPWFKSPVTLHASTADSTATCDADTAYAGPDVSSKTVTLTCIDPSGNVGSGSYGLGYDATAPVLGVSGKTTGDNQPYVFGTWTNQSVAVNETCYDLLSGIATCPSMVAGDPFGTSVTYTASATVPALSVTDGAGNTSTTPSYPVKIDKTAPVVTVKLDRSPDSGGWYNQAVTATATSDDDGLSPVTCDKPVTYSTPSSGAAQVTMTCTDDAGNKGTGTAAFKFDSTDPDIDAVAKVGSDTYVPGAWTKGPVDVKFYCLDADSLVASCTGDQTVTDETSSSGVDVTGNAVDNAGNKASKTVLVKIDLSKPTISAVATVGGKPYVGDWTNQDVKVHFVCSDALSGVQTCPDDVTVSNETASSGLVVSGTAVDKVGNTNTDSVTVKIDKTAPVVTASIDRPADSSGWYNHALTVSAQGTDALSGGVTCESPVTYMGPDAASKSISRSCTDAAGNTGSDSVSFKFDSTGPSLNPSVTPNPVVLNGTATATAGATDSLSGVDTATCDTVVTSSVGTKSVGCKATDKAGNTTSKSASYKVGYIWRVVQPVNDTAHQTTPDYSTFKAGSTVPLKVQLLDANGKLVTAAVAPQWLAPQKGAATTEAIDESLYTDPGTTGTAFKFDATTSTYQYNWATTKSQAGSYWKLTFALDDGNTGTVTIALR